jgi:hypothetical protein
MVAPTTVMAPPMTPAMTMAAPDLDERTIRANKVARRCYGHS